jgi:hypothetical protein
MKRSSRILFAAACVLVLAAGFSLFVLSEQTDRFFAWTIDPPITAAFMGAAYFSAAVLQFGASRETSWSRAGAILPGIIVFTLMTLAATLIHIDRFHMDSPIAWTWLFVYLAFPPFGIAVLLNQGVWVERGRSVVHPLSGASRVLIAAQAIPLTIFGLLLFAIPATTLTFWPWTLTPLTARAIGAWLVGMGITAALEYFRNDETLSRLLSAGKLVLVALIALAVLRYSADVQWGEVPAWLFALVLGLLLTNSALVFISRTHALPQVQPPEPDSPA